MDFYKYHGLGNDYLVMHPLDWKQPITPEAVRLICDRHRGIGADGIMWGPLPGLSGSYDQPAPGPEDNDPRPAVRILNPDGSEGEKSGNGLRIFASHLWQLGMATQSPFELRTPGGLVAAEVLNEPGDRLSMEMGQVTFNSEKIPVKGAARDVLNERWEVNGEQLTLSCASIGNPHCVVQSPNPTPEQAHALGPHLENHPAFPNRSNVQFMAVIDPHTIRIEIWERGAGYTQASGSSSCAAAAVAVKLGLVSSPVRVLLAGGELEVHLNEAFSARLVGDVASVGSGRFSDAFLQQAKLERA